MQMKHVLLGTPLNQALAHRPAGTSGSSGATSRLSDKHATLHAGRKGCNQHHTLHLFTRPQSTSAVPYRQEPAVPAATTIIPVPLQSPALSCKASCPACTQHAQEHTRISMLLVKCFSDAAKQDQHDCTCRQLSRRTGPECSLVVNTSAPSSLTHLGLQDRCS